MLLEQVLYRRSGDGGGQDTEVRHFQDTPRGTWDTRNPRRTRRSEFPHFVLGFQRLYSENLRRPCHISTTCTQKHQLCRGTLYSFCCTQTSTMQRYCLFLRFWLAPRWVSPVPGRYKGKPLQVLGNRQSVYLNHLNGCRPEAGEYHYICDNFEFERLLMNERQPQSIINTTDVGFKKGWGCNPVPSSNPGKLGTYAAYDIDGVSVSASVHHSTAPRNPASGCPYGGQQGKSR